MNKKIIIKKIADNLYNRSVFVAVGEQNETMRKFEKYHKLDPGTLVPDPRAGGALFYLPSGGFLVWLEHYKGSAQDTNILIHEVFHLVHAVLGQAGLRLTDDSEEAYAYLAGYFAREITKAIK